MGEINSVAGVPQQPRVFSALQKEGTVMHGLRTVLGADADIDISDYYNKDTGFTEKGLKRLVPMIGNKGYFKEPGNLNNFTDILKNDIASKLRSGVIAKSTDSNPASIYETPPSSVLPFISDPLPKDVTHAKMAYMAIGIMDGDSFFKKDNGDWTFYGSYAQEATGKFQDKYMDLSPNDQRGRLGKKTVDMLINVLETGEPRKKEGI